MGPSACWDQTTANGGRALPTPHPLPPLGYAPVQRPPVTSILASEKIIDGLEIGKDSEDRKYPIKLFEKAQLGNKTGQCRTPVRHYSEGHSYGK